MRIIRDHEEATSSLTRGDDRFGLCGVFGASSHDDLLLWTSAAQAVSFPPDVSAAGLGETATPSPHPRRCERFGLKILSIAAEPGCHQHSENWGFRAALFQAAGLQHGLDRESRTGTFSNDCCPFFAGQPEGKKFLT
jgi:hypothetical protein